MSEQALHVVESLDQATVILEPTRLRIVRELAEPDSASGLARRLELPRQRVNYHIQALEKAGLVKLVAERRRRNCTERIVQATARAYVISPEILASAGKTPSEVRDRFSWAYLVSAAARIIRELGILRRWADREHKRLATITFETEIRVTSPARLQAIADELANTVADISARHHDERTADGRVFRFVIGGYPAITRELGVKEDTGRKPVAD